jgi:hypothetical protein
VPLVYDRFYALIEDKGRGRGGGCVSTYVDTRVSTIRRHTRHYVPLV